MAFTSYITYEEYTALGGTLSSTDFPIWERKAQRQLDYYTFNRISALTTIPDEVKEVLTEFINRMFSQNASSFVTSSASSYSNGVESVTFKDNAEAAFNNELVKLAIDWLPACLTARSVNFGIEQYLQSENNDT